MTTDTVPANPVPTGGVRPSAQTGAESRSDPHATARAPHSCSVCGRRWNGFQECHCAACHRSFGAISSFDAHRQGPIEHRECADPDTLTRKDGNPKLTPVVRSDGVVWVAWTDPDKATPNLWATS